MTPLGAGLILGLASGVHCLAMCGPLTLAVRHVVGGGRRVSASGMYHGARTAVYVLLGALSGWAGAAWSRGLPGRSLSVIAGVSLLALAVGGFRRRGPGFAGASVTRVLASLFALVRRHAGRHPIASPALAGAANALLPCGLLYGALVTSAAWGNVRSGALFMAAYGAGTAASLVALWIGVPLVPRSGGQSPSRLRRLAPAALALVAVLLIARGVASDANTPSSHAAAHGHAH